MFTRKIENGTWSCDFGNIRPLTAVITAPVIVLGSSPMQCRHA